MKIRLLQTSLFPCVPPPTKLYNLLWNGQTIVANAPYPVCNGKKTQLSRSGYSKHLFTIKPAN